MWTGQLRVIQTLTLVEQTITWSSILVVWNFPSGMEWAAVAVTLRFETPESMPPCIFFSSSLTSYFLVFLKVFIQTQGAPNLMLSILRDEYPDAPLVLRGTNSQGALSQQYQPVLMMSKSYTLHWNGPAPRETVLSLINFDKWVSEIKKNK